MLQIKITRNLSIKQQYKICVWYKHLEKYKNIFVVFSWKKRSSTHLIISFPLEELLILLEVSQYLNKFFIFALYFHLIKIQIIKYYCWGYNFYFNYFTINMLLFYTHINIIINIIIYCIYHDFVYWRPYWLTRFRFRITLLLFRCKKNPLNNYIIHHYEWWQCMIEIYYWNGEGD